MIEILQDAIIDTLKLIPFLFITYLIMEYLENKTSSHLKQKIQKAGRFGPLLGGIFGILPQCGISASSTNLYVERYISIGTLIAVYLSTSDEMLPIFISEQVPIFFIIKILALKLVISIIFGFIIDYLFIKINKYNSLRQKEVDLCKQDNCHCHEKGILKSSLKHTLNITIYIFIITLIINCIIDIIGQNQIENFVSNNIIFGPAISSFIGLIPNCAASVIITNLYIEGVINASSLLAGLLTGAGVGLIVLFKTNKTHIKENFSILLILYIIGVISGLFLQYIGFSLNI